MHDDELHAAFIKARRSERIQLLDLLSSKLDRLAVGNMTKEQVISTLKDWINSYQRTGGGNQ
ncbi:hypothetical protein FS595_09075 [Serratia rubidaea]|uniref:hypothetical protein n=1 Tax=Serratia rubidaea TaxID=61652 RepID=UPI001F1A10A2|nr:hypothetical protein [Serratia rubidaea]UJD79842.1 hypothetical protein FS596_09075 [Serratia rubidaea]UJD84398.1 hypothetical protein FS595_09075 [Serratia rubidaea]